MRTMTRVVIFISLCCLCSCGSSSQPAGGKVLPAALVEATLPGLQALPAAIKHTAATVTVVTLDGWSETANHTDNAVQAGASVQLPSGASELSAAWYGTSVDYNSMGALPYLAPYEITIHTSGSGNFYVLFANYRELHWVAEQGTFTGASVTVPVTLSKNASNLDGNFWFAILTYGGESVTVDTIDLTYPAAPLAGSPVDYQQFITAADGTQLATDIYLPYAEASPIIPNPPYPAVLMRTPYDKSMIDAGLFATLTQANVIVMVQYFRGRLGDTGAWPDSGGTETLFRDHAGPDYTDAIDTVDWLEARHWYNSTLVSSGPSALGLWIYQANTVLGDRLAGMFPQVSAGNVATWAAIANGCFKQGNVEGWLIGNGFPPALYDDVQANAFNADYWAPYDFDSQAATAQAPGYHETGWWDVSVEATIKSWRELNANGGAGAAGQQWLVIGPWSHDTLRLATVGELAFPLAPDASNPSVIPDAWDGLYFSMARLGRNPFFAYPTHHVRAYWIGEEGNVTEPHNHWYEFDTWPPVSTPLTFNLNTGVEGLMVATPPDATLAYTTDPADPVATLGGANLLGTTLATAGPYDQTLPEGHSGVLKFRSFALGDRLSIGGPIVLELSVSTDAADTDLMVKLIDEYPGGEQMLVADNALRLSWWVKHNTSDTAVVPDKVYTVSFEIGQRGYVFATGHKLGLDVQGTNYPRFAINPGNGDGWYDGTNGVIQNNTLYLGGTNVSRLTLPAFDPLLN